MWKTAWDTTSASSGAERCHTMPPVPSSGPRGDTRLDMTDLYAFPKPGDPGKSILVLNVHPSVGVNPPGPTTKEPFAPGALYDFKPGRPRRRRIRAEWASGTA